MPAPRSPSPSPSPSPTWGPAALAGQTQAANWSIEEVRALLQHYGLNPQQLHAAALPGGWENLNLLVHAGGERYVLRRYDSTEPSEVPWELHLLSYLAERGFPTPSPLRRRDGSLLTTFRARAAALFPFVEGRHPRWDEPDAPTVAAEAIGRLHQLTSGLTLLHPRSSQDDHAKLTRFHAWLAARPPVAEDEPLHTFAREATLREAEFFARLADVERTIGPLPRGVVHADAHGNNLLVHPESFARLVALLDFDDAHESLLLTDVCSLVDIWALDRDTHQEDPPRGRRVLAAYTRLRPLTPPERELFPDVLALKNCAGTTSYVIGRVNGGATPARAIADCGQHAGYRRRTAAPGWRQTLREAFLG